MLRVGTDLTPDDRAGIVIDPLTVTVDRLAVALHLQLGQIVGDIFQPAIVRQHGMAAGTEKIVVPDPQQRQQHRHILRQRCRAEMLIQRVRPSQELAKAVHPDQ